MSAFIEWIGDIWFDHKRGIGGLIVMFGAIWLSAFLVHFFMSEWWVVPLVFNLGVVWMIGFVVSLIHAIEKWG